MPNLIVRGTCDSAIRLYLTSSQYRMLSFHIENIRLYIEREQRSSVAVIREGSEHKEKQEAMDRSEKRERDGDQPLQRHRLFWSLIGTI